MDEKLHCSFAQHAHRLWPSVRPWSRGQQLATHLLHRIGIVLSIDAVTRPSTIHTSASLHLASRDVRWKDRMPVTMRAHRERIRWSNRKHYHPDSSYSSLQADPRPQYRRTTAYFRHHWPPKGSSMICSGVYWSRNLTIPLIDRGGYALGEGPRRTML